MPIPNFRYYAPAVSGVVMREGLPVQQAKVHVAGNYVQETRSVVTASDGRFSTEAIRKLLLTASLIGDPLYSYSVEIVVGDKVYAGYSEASVGYAPKSAQLKCDLSRLIRVGSREVYCSLEGQGE